VVYGQSFSFVGLAVATLFFAASLTPSLLPRTFVVEGVLAGFALALGYGIGLALLQLYLFLGLPRPGARVQRTAKLLTVIAVGIVFVSFLWRITYWQNSVRELMEMEPLQRSYSYWLLAIAIVVGIVLNSLGRSFLWAGGFVSRRLGKYLPPRVAAGLGFTIVALAALFLANDIVVAKLLDAADRFFAAADATIDDGIEQPTDDLACGSEASLVPWDTIGRRGKTFIAGGPTENEIAGFLDRPAKQPIRVYVGLRSRPTKRLQAQLALEELKRCGGFERSTLIIATPTGTGWLDPSGVNTVEYLHGGDTAIVSMQYSYLPSWITILVNPRHSIESARELFDEVYRHWTTLPKDSRPQLYLHGLSLGALGSEQAADLYTIFEDPIQGAVWSGPPFASREWRTAVINRNEGTPPWLPTFRDGRLLRFTARENALDREAPWSPMRFVYIQHASDPMIWFSPDLAWSSPEWLRDPRGPDVSPFLRWVPMVTFLQIAFDMPMATSVPLGYGHNYAPSSYIDAWRAVTDPSSWSDESIERLKTHFQNMETPKP
jgi:uncharacterized membrane protein